MNITIIGSSQLRNKMEVHKKELEAHKHYVKLPAFDDNPNLDSIGICEYNIKAIEWADEVHIFWDNRSVGTIFDFGMTFALRKPVRIIYLENKTLDKVMLQWELRTHGELNDKYMGHNYYWAFMC